MTPVKTEYANIIFTAEGCKDLPGTLAVNENGTHEIETCWELSPEELEQVNKTGRIYLYVVGRSIPPVALTTESQLIVGGEKTDEV